MSRKINHPHTLLTLWTCFLYFSFIPNEGTFPRVVRSAVQQLVQCARTPVSCPTSRPTLIKNYSEFTEVISWPPDSALITYMPCMWDKLFKSSHNSRRLCKIKLPGGLWLLIIVFIGTTLMGCQHIPPPVSRPSQTQIYAPDENWQWTREKKICLSSRARLVYFSTFLSNLSPIRNSFCMDRLRWVVAWYEGGAFEQYSPPFVMFILWRETLMPNTMCAKLR